LLALASAEFDVLITADKGIEYQQNRATLPIAVLVVVARSNLLRDLMPLVPDMLQALAGLRPRTLLRIHRGKDAD
jgi:hypothetical protein